MKLTQPSLSSPSVPAVSALALNASAGQGLVRSGLVAEYRFNEGSGQVLHDYSGNNNHGVLGSTTGADTNDPTWTGKGASFTTDDYISGTNILGLSKYTIFAVVSPTSTSGWGCICGKNTGSSAGAGKSGFFLRRGGGDLNLQQYDSNGDLCSATKTNALSVSSWCMAIGVCDGINVYCGTANSPLAKSSESMGTVAPNNTLNVRVGAYAYTESIFWEGSVAYFAMWNRALTQAEINQNYAYLKSYLLRERGIVLA
jgi:hypothetical protein